MKHYGLPWVPQRIKMETKSFSLSMAMSSCPSMLPANNPCIKWITVPFNVSFLLLYNLPKNNHQRLGYDASAAKVSRNERATKDTQYEIIRQTRPYRTSNA